MNIYIYDIEVFSDDWIVDFSRPELDAPHITIHNDNVRLRAFLDQPGIILGGFNNKHYDDYVVMVMLAGGYGKYGTHWRKVGDHYFCTK